MAHSPSPQETGTDSRTDSRAVSPTGPRLGSNVLEAQLEAHRAFLQRLARSLVGDAALAEDLVQETALAALKHGPRLEQSRGWLARVLRRKVTRHRERTGLRESRQRAAASPESVASHAAAIDRRLDLEHVITDRVRALPIAQARAIGLRYAEDMTIPEIARALDVPEATIKTRLKRGLARLREDMDRAHGGDGKQWLSALAPIVGVEWTGAGLKAAGASSGAGISTAVSLAPWIAACLLVMGAGVALKLSGGRKPTFPETPVESPAMAKLPGILSLIHI